MKQQAIQYVALDVHKATLVVSMRDEQGSVEQGSVVMCATVATEAKAVVGLVRGLESRVPLNCCFRARNRLAMRGSRCRLSRPCAGPAVELPTSARE